MATFSLGDLAEDCIPRLQGVHKNLNIDAHVLKAIWERTFSFIESQMLKEKAVNFPGFGTFTFIHDKLELGNKGQSIVRAPVFVVSDIFTQLNGMKKQKTSVSVATAVPVVSINHALIASESNSHRDIVIDFLKESLRGLGNAMRTGRNVSIGLGGLGSLHASGSGGGTVRVQFNSDFSATIKNMSSPTRRINRSEELMTRPSTETASDKVTFSRSISPTKSGAISANSTLTMTSTSPFSSAIASSPPPSRGGNRLSTPDRGDRDRDRDDAPPSRPTTSAGGRRGSADVRSDNVSLPKVASSDDRPKAPVRKTRFSSDDINFRTYTPAHDHEDDVCEACNIADLRHQMINNSVAHDRTIDIDLLEADKSHMAALDDKDKMTQMARREARLAAEKVNRDLMQMKQEQAVREKSGDYFGNVFYAQRPSTPENVRKGNYKMALEDQMSEHSKRTTEHRLETVKDRDSMQEERRRHEEEERRRREADRNKKAQYAEFLVQQMAQQKTTPIDFERSESPTRFERSVRPSTAPAASGGLSIAGGSYFAAGSGTLADNMKRPPTAELLRERRSAAVATLTHHRDHIVSNKTRDQEDRAREAEEHELMRRRNEELRLKEQQAELTRKLQTKERLRSAWASQLQEKVTHPHLHPDSGRSRNSLDIGELDAVRHSKKNCKKCGRGIMPLKNHRRISGDFRLSSNEITTRQVLSLHS